MQEHYAALQPVMIGKKKGLKCRVCLENIVDARNYAKNGQVPIADGIRCDGIKALQRVVDHLLGNVHAGAVHAEKNKKEWEKQSDNHPWVKNYEKTRLSNDFHTDQINC